MVCMRASTYGRQSRSSEKSIQEQLDAGHSVIGEQGWTNAGDYQDGKSASRFGTGQRDDWQRLLADVVAENLDVLILWESSRGDRTDTTWLAFLDDCRDHGVRIYVITHERLYNLKNARDRKTLAEDGVNNAYESELISIRVRRGHLGAAEKGKPAGGPCPYGFRKTFDSQTGKRTGQTIHEEEAAQVRLLYKLLSEGTPVRSVARALQATEKASIQWTPKRVRTLALSPVYVALRGHYDATYPAVWDAIVTEEQWTRVQQLLNAPGRRTGKPGNQVHLLSYLAKCGVCSEYLDCAEGVYRCRVAKHVTLHKRFMDEVITELVKARLKRPDALAAFVKRDDEDNQNLQSQLKKLKDRLEDVRHRAIVLGTLPLEALEVAETDLAGKISKLETQVQQENAPQVLLDFLKAGKDIEKSWNDASLIVKRALIKSLCEITLIRVPGFTGRPSDEVMRQRTLKRLSKSRWVGDSRTWGEVWAA